MSIERSKDDDDNEDEPESDATEAESDEEEEEAPRPERRRASEEAEPGTATKTLGLERWVQFTFVGIAVVTFFIGDKLITLVWDYVAEPIPLASSGAAAVLGAVTAVGLYYNKRTKSLADEVAGEMSKVTWPTRQETWYSSVVVIITSIVAAIYVGLFDALWSAFTDLIYSTS